MPPIGTSTKNSSSTSGLPGGSNYEQLPPLPALPQSRNEISDDDSFHLEKKKKLDHNEHNKPNIKGTITKLVFQWAESFSGPNADDVFKLYGKNAVVYSIPFQDTAETPKLHIGHTCIKHYFTTLKTMQWYRCNVIDPCPDITEQEGGYSAKGTYNFTAISSTKKLKFCFEIVYAHEDGGWKIAVHNSSVVPNVTMEDICDVIDEAESSNRISDLKANRLRECIEADSPIESIQFLVAEHIPTKRKGMGLYKCKVCLIPKKNHTCIYCHACSTPENKVEKADHHCKYCLQCFEEGKRKKKHIKIMRGMCKHRDDAKNAAVSKLDQHGNA
mmetsp:Transcript_1446/g.3350  ORF Transcript_1446/g.3350 Transcript_1446/m.3350 type:complete len:329 (-) Transcript_1446:187-1173(-)